MKVLVIDDEALVRRSLGRALRAKGHEVQEASDGLQGLQMWIEFCPDLVYLDVLMPGMSGPQVLQERARLPGQAKVILISAYSGEHNPETAERLGADRFLAKPFEDIFAVVRMGEGLVKNGTEETRTEN